MLEQMGIELRPTTRATQLADKLRSEFENMEYEILEHATREHDYVKMLMDQNTEKLQKTMQRVEQHHMEQQQQQLDKSQKSRKNSSSTGKTTTVKSATPTSPTTRSVQQRSKSPTAGSMVGNSGGNLFYNSSNTSSNLNGSTVSSSTVTGRTPLGLFSANNIDNSQLFNSRSAVSPLRATSSNSNGSSSTFNNYDILGKMSKLIPS